MASGIASPLGIAGIIFIVIGMILAIVGVILLIVNQNLPKEWYIWVLLIGGLVIGVAGGIMLAVAFALEPKEPCVEMCGVSRPVVREVPVAPVSACAVKNPTPAISNITTHTVGTPQFDPNPVKTTVIYHSDPYPTSAIGPYGPGGALAKVSGIYTPPATAVTYTSDIPNHNVAVAGPAPSLNIPVEPLAGLPMTAIQTTGQPVQHVLTPPAAMGTPVQQYTAVPGVQSQTVHPAHAVIRNGQIMEHPTHLVAQQNPVQQCTTACPRPLQSLAPPPVQAAIPPGPITQVTSSNAGLAQFDPDPVRTTVTYNNPSYRTDVVGPYGSNGALTRVSGVYTPPPTAVTYTSDIPNQNVLVAGPQPQPMYR